LRYLVARVQKHKGFTLVEMIISIGIIAIISSSILQLFITASNLNRKSYDIDKSVMISETIIGKFKSGNGPQDIKKINLMKDAYVSERNKSLFLSIYFDQKWKTMAKVTYSSELNLKKAAAYILKAEVYPLISAKESSTSGVFGIKLSVTKQKYGYLEKKTVKALFSINAAKYFAGARVD
jgi:prepilin-type N-terminal cleavage/methylation domain-containing protein